MLKERSSLKTSSPDASAEKEEGSAASAGKAPMLSLPKGGGAIRGLGEKFTANPVTGTATMTVPLVTSPSRSGFGPQGLLSYDSGAGNGPFGFGWNLSLPAITRKTDKGLPQYRDAEESDVFILSNAEDLVPVLVQAGTQWQRDESPSRTVNGVDHFSVHTYRPRIEGLFARIERWVNLHTGETHWRSISRDNVTTLYGKENNSRLFDPNEEDLKHPQRIFTWLISESYDDKGNAIIYEYKEENADGVDLSQAHEKNRTALTRSANRYLKRIKYGNRVSRLVQPDLSKLSKADWMFEVVFDYGEHDADAPKPDISTDWLCRHDAFSTYRAGFEIRTYRLCQRVLMFHHFPDEQGIGQDCLVRSTDFIYQNMRSNPDDFKKGHPIASFIASVTQSGYKRQAGGYLKKSLPPLEFEYSQPMIQEEIQEVDTESLQNLPYGLDGTHYQWVDLDGEGVSGILSEQAEGWFYKRNLSPIPVRHDDGEEIVAARFAPVELVAQQPSVADANERQHFLDLAGDGRLDLVQFRRPLSGYYKRTEEGSWSKFVPFESIPTVSWDDPNLKFVDLTGDGHADLIVSEDNVFIWYPSLAEAGFGAAQRVGQVFDEEKGPRLVFDDSSQSVYLADLSGDGLTDLVRIRNGEVCYWPSLGYGRFGAKVTMDNGPWFDRPELFDQRRIHLADIDGSGVTDIIYLSQDGVHLYFNQSGNSWTEARTLRSFPQIDNLSAVTALDLLGNGTACLVWSSPLPGHARRPMYYIDLMGGQKPHLMVGIKNNLGAETRTQYSTSTKFYLKDKAAGTPWATRLPFPVHVVERVEVLDRISRNRFVTRYAYHHGFFDGIEREFRGFGMVEQLDTEEFASLSASDLLPDATNLDAATHVPPMLTKTWFHTGAWFEGRRISLQFEQDYYREGDPSLGEAGLNEAQLKAMLLADTNLPETILRQDGTHMQWMISGDEAAEACRALKGSILRQEVYALDGTEAQDRPYSVSERNYTIEMLQPRAVNKYAVFFSHPRETIDFHYERKLFEINRRKVADPRVTHAMTLAVDGFGNVLQSVAIGYGRRYDDPDPLLTDEDRQKQKRTRLTYTENRYTKPVQQADDYRAPLPCETRTYELRNVEPEANQPGVTNLFRINEFDEMPTKIQATSVRDLPYENLEGSGIASDESYRRLIEHVRTLYRQDDLSNPLLLGELSPRALPFESYKLAFTPALLGQVFGDRVVDAMLANEGRYVHSEGDNNWWIPSGRVFYSINETDTAAQELDRAIHHFFLPRRFLDPFGNPTTVDYDTNDLLPARTRDALGNVVQSQNDYRVLQPHLITDPNGNRAAAAFDALGMVVGTAVMGKESEHLGDSLTGFEPDIDPATIIAHLQTPFANPQDILQRATTRLIYDLHRYERIGADANPQPVVVCTLARETHDADLSPGEQTRIQQSFSYSDGFGREIQKKIQAEPGPTVEGGPAVNLRWVGSGWTIFNNKGKPVRQYEPFFSSTHQFEFGKTVGVSPIIFYDPVERAVATLHANHTYEKVVFDPWQQTTFDVNDTVAANGTETGDPRTDADIKGYVAEYFKTQPNTWQTWHQQRIAGALGVQEQSAAIKTAVHAGTPTVAYFDTLGRVFLTVAHNRFERTQNGTSTTIEEKYSSRLEIDIEGNQRKVIDARRDSLSGKGRTVMRYDYDMLSNRIHQASMEAGERWMLNDVAGKPIRAWNSRGHRFTAEYDALHRPLRSLVQGADPDKLERDILFERIIYGEQHPNAETLNLRGHVFMQFDGAGVVTDLAKNPESGQDESYDFKGNLLRSSRRLAREYKKAVDWISIKTVLPPDRTSPISLIALEAALTPLLERETFTSSTQYDALNRAVSLTTPDNSVMRLVYNEANLLERIEANLRASAIATPFVEDIDYNAKGQRVMIKYGNGAQTQYSYDPQTFRLTHLLTRREAATFLDDCPSPPPTGWPGCEVQNLHYTYDPAGNITHIRDDAQQTVYFRNRRVEPSAEYTYDAIYRLIGATGREHLGQADDGSTLPPTPTSATDAPRVRLLHPNDGNAMGRYLQQYVYDEVGNIKEMIHRGTDPANAGWARGYTYNEPSTLEPGRTSNRLTSTRINGTSEAYTYDAHGNLTTMPHLPLMRWDYQDRLEATSQQVVNNGGTPETTYYVYDGSGQRVRKVTERQAATGVTPTRKAERLYLGSFEIYREYNGDNSTMTLERETLHVMDDKQRIALIETRTQGNDGSPARLIRFQLSNHLGCACLELDGQAQIISYEEYYPYGSTSYQAVRSKTETPKRYRYTGKERDEESGLYYHGARYYAPWLGRWTTPDPAGLVDGINVFAYVRGNPIRLNDQTGTQSKDQTMRLSPPSILDPRTSEQRLREKLSETFSPGRLQLNLPSIPQPKSSNKSIKYVEPSGRDIVVHPSSQLNASEIVAKIRADDRIPEYLREGFTAVEGGEQGSLRVAAPKDIRVPGQVGKIVPLPRWYVAAHKAATSGKWQITTGELTVTSVDKKGVVNTGQIMPDYPGAFGNIIEEHFTELKSGHISSLKDIPGGITIPPYNPTLKGDLMLTPGGKKGLIVFANRIAKNEMSNQQSLARIVESPAILILHEIVHAGLIEAGIPFNEHHPENQPELKDEAFRQLETM